MGAIQNSINQSLAILSIAASQNPGVIAKKKAIADTKAFNKFVKTDKKTPFVLGDTSEDMFNELKKQAIDSNLKAGQTEELVKIKDTKPEIENIKNDIKDMLYEQNYSDEASEMIANDAISYFRKYSINDEPNIASVEVRKKVNEAIGRLQQKYYAKNSIKKNMDMMKSELKEDN